MNTSRTTTKILTVLLLGGAVITAACSLRARAPLVAHERHSMTSAEMLAADVSAGDAATRSRAQALLGKLPLYFVENRGQEDAQVAYYLQGRDTAVYFTGTGVTFALSGPKPDGAVIDRLSPDSDDHPQHGPRLSVRRVALATERPARERWAVRLDFVGANAVTPHGEEPTAAVVSYFKGGDRQSQIGLKTFASVVYRRALAGHRPRLHRHRRAAQVHVPRQARR